MHLSLVRPFLRTLPRLSGTKHKSDSILVRCHSVVSHYQLNRIRQRLGDKLEFLAFDPLIQREVLFKEEKKVRSIPTPKNISDFTDFHIRAEREKPPLGYHYLARNEIEGKDLATKEEKAAIRKQRKLLKKLPFC